MNLATLHWGAAHWALPLAVVAIAFVVLVVWAYFYVPIRRQSAALAAGLKVAAVLLLILCLLEPLASGTRPRPGANVVALLVDNSQSMQVHGRGLPAGGEIVDWLGSDTAGWRARLAQDFSVRTYRFDRDLQLLEDVQQLSFTGESSGLSQSLEALAHRFTSQPLAGVILLTDGNATDATKPTDEWTLPNCPLFPVLPTDASAPQDLRLEHVQISQSHFETSPTSVTADVSTTGDPGGQVVAQLVAPDGAIVEEQQVKFPPQSTSQSVRFRFKPAQPGLAFYRLHVFSEADRETFANGRSRREATLANNTRILQIDRGGGPYRLLYLAGRPNWEFKYLRRALADDEELQLVGLLRIANQEPKFQFQDRAGVSDTNPLFQGFENNPTDAAETYDKPVLVRIGVGDSQELADGFPATADLLYRYDAVILDDIEASFFTPDQMLLLRQYVSQRGGSLLMLGGIQTFAEGAYARTPLGELLPVYLPARTEAGPVASVRVELTRQGWLEPWARLRAKEVDEQQRLSEMPSFRSLNQVGGIKPGAILVAQANDGTTAHPAMVTQRFGKGRTGALLIGDLWHWSLQRQTDRPDDQAVFWRQTLRWLVADTPPRAELQVDPSSNGTAPWRLTATIRTPEFLVDDNASVEFNVVRPNGEHLTLTATTGQTESGSYEAEFWPSERGGYRVAARIVAGDGDVIAPRPTGAIQASEEREFQQLEINRPLLTDLATRSQGRVIEPAAISAFVRELQREPVPVTETWVAPLWHQAWVLLLAIACLCGEWGLRRWKGLS